MQGDARKTPTHFQFVLESWAGLGPYLTALAQQLLRQFPVVCGMFHNVPVSALPLLWPQKLTRLLVSPLFLKRVQRLWYHTFAVLFVMLAVRE